MPGSDSITIGTEHVWLGSKEMATLSGWLLYPIYIYLINKKGGGKKKATLSQKLFYVMATLCDILLYYAGGIFRSPWVHICHHILNIKLEETSWVFV